MSSEDWAQERERRLEQIDRYNRQAILALSVAVFFLALGVIALAIGQLT